MEVYSDKPNDASNQETYEGFLAILRNAFTAAVKCLKPNRFACIVVGDVRDKRGFYYDFPGDIKRMFKEAGMELYNDIILVDPLGTAAIRAAKMMLTRKVVKVHQNVLVFYKGDPKLIKDNYKEVQCESEDMERFGLAGGDSAGETAE